MDAFFVSVELLSRPELRGRPVVVGGAGSRGVVAAASYEARAYGVFSAMPSSRAQRLCPQAVFLPGDHARYQEVSGRVMAIFASYTPLVEPLSLDEAFLDVTGARRVLGAGAQIGRAIRAAVLEQEGLTCTVGDIADLPEQALIGLLGDVTGRHIGRLAKGIDPRPVEPDQEAKSIGHEETFPADHHDADVLGREVVRMADAVAWRLRRAGRAARTVTLKVRFGDFRTITRSVTLPVPVDEGPALARAAGALLAEVDPTPGVRLLGVTGSGLVAAAARQLTFDDAEGPSWHAASGAVDAIRERFGGRAIGPASALSRRGLRVKQRGDAPWGPDDDPATATRDDVSQD